ncbi:hypothetical protein [Chamaesiphon sp. VAR_69_metabat_338]|uniref:hypothetical protein n=1 Tax=Chamaesiphon sp. VAR_69_metabat_338 TaxID=2964704 RepID=UPI00286D7F33|nr:hypothetical protein [Chamaesiphon sp. VAR_69_metabat_338]
MTPIQFLTACRNRIPNSQQTWRRAALAIATVTMLTACGLTNGNDVSTKSVETFHQQFNNSEFSEMYSNVKPDAGVYLTETDFMKLFQSVRRQLGSVKSATQSGSTVHDFSGGRQRVVLTYKTDFEKGTGIETFSFMVSSDAATLQDYSIRSNELITN